jgi:hypothetical protein
MPTKQSSMSMKERYHILIREISDKWSDEALFSLCRNEADRKIRDAVLAYRGKSTNSSVVPHK